MSKRQGRPGADNTTPALKGSQISTPEAGTITCARCLARWGGLKTAHCNTCHETFTVVAAFDRHRAGSHTLDDRIPSA
jgi:hypothetical protein